MAKRTPPNNRPWPENLIFDFNLAASTTTDEAEAFISSLPTSEKNKTFIRLRYQEGKPYKDIAPAYGISAGAVRQAIIYVKDKVSGKNNNPSSDKDNTEVAVDLLSLVDNSTAPPEEQEEQDDQSAQGKQLEQLAQEEQDTQGGTEEATITTSESAQDTTITSSPVPEQSSIVSQSQPSPKKIREELKPIITAIATTTRLRTFVYDSKTRVVLPSDNVPRGLRKDNRYIPLPDYYQIKEYDLMQEFATSLAATDQDKSGVLTIALGGVGPFKAFRSAIRDIGLGQEWADYRYQRFVEMAESWWDREVNPALSSREAEIASVASGQPIGSDQLIGSAQPIASVQAITSGQPIASSTAAPAETKDVLIVDPTTLNGIALIETIRILFRRVGPGDFEAALDELRDALCGFSQSRPEEQ